MPATAQPARSKPEWRLGPPNCPYCGEHFDAFPKRKRKCPACKKLVVIWSDESRSERTLLTESRAAILEADAAAERRANAEAAAPGLFLRRIRRRIQDGQLSDAEIMAQLDKSASGGDATWALYHVALQREMKRSDFTALSNLYHSMALFLDKEGRDFKSTLREAYRCDLQAIIRSARESDGVFKDAVEIRGGACDACRALEGSRFTFAEALRTNPLPCEECSNYMYSERSGFCRCMYQSVID